MTQPGRLPPRTGPRPRTTPTNPHTQIDQQPDDLTIRGRLARRLFSLTGVQERPSLISVPGARALVVADPGGAPADAFMVGREFAHLHPVPDLSLHVALPPELARAAVETGWGEVHPVARRGLIPSNVVMLYAPRDDEELEVVAGLVEAAWRRAARSGAPPAADTQASVGPQGWPGRSHGSFGP